MIIDDYDPLKGEILQILDKDGNYNEKFKPTLTDKEVIELYKIMYMGRFTDKKALALQRQGRMVTYVPTAGQEACSVGSVHALKKTDWFVPAFREAPGMFHRGSTLVDLLLYMKGFEKGSQHLREHNMTPMAVPVGTQIVHAVGLSWGAKIKGDKIGVMVHFGDGATSEGDFHEACNFAGVFQTPTVFFCNNNQWAISVPRKHQTHSKTLAQKAVAYGFHGLQIDGNDLFAVHLATKEALEKARKGGGPTLIEAVTYRQGPHTTADDPKKYRDPKDEKYWLARDPITRLKKYLEKKKLWSDQKDAALKKQVDKDVEAALKVMEATQYTGEDMFKYQYAEMTPQLKEQLEEFKTFENLK